MLGLERDFLVLLNSRLTTADAAKGADLEFPPAAFLLEPDQGVISRTAAFGNVKIEYRLPLLHVVVRRRSIQIRIPMLSPHAVGEKTAGPPARLRLAYRLPLDENESGAILPVDAHFRGRQIGVDRDRGTSWQYRHRGAGLIITLITASETFAAFSAFRLSTLVSNFRPSAPLTLRIFAIMTSSERPAATIAMMSWLVSLLAISWPQAEDARKRQRSAIKHLGFLMRHLV